VTTIGRVAPVVAALLVAACNQVFGLEPVVARDAPSGPDAPPVPVDEIVAGGAHTCARIGDRVRCWGSGARGQLGGNAEVDVLSAAAAPEVDVGPVGRLVAGAEHTCVLLTEGKVACWGAGTNGRLGYGNVNDVGDDEVPRAAGTVDLGGGQVSVLAAGAAHTCAAVPGIAMRCWGAFAEGRLGNNAMEDIGDAETPAMSQAVAGSGGALVIAAGAAHTCFLDGNGQVRCFGRGTNGQLGYGATTSLPAPGGPVEIGNAATGLVAGDDHTCVVQIDNAVRCWGRGLDGRLGSGSTMDIGTISDPGVFAPVGLGGGARALAAGARHTCALLTSGGVVCWGANDHGQLGYGNRMPVGASGPPSAAGTVPLPGEALAITAGGDHTCALLAGGGVICWGANDHGQLGYGDHEDRGDDEPVGGLVPL